MEVSAARAVGALLGGYQAAVWPAIPAAYSLAALAVASAFRPSRRSDTLAGASLAALWLWTGLAWFSMTAGRVAQQPAWFFGGVFVAQAALIGLAVTRRRLRFRFSGGAARWLGLALIVDATVAYPLSGPLAGRPFPAAPAFGVTPWPVVVFTLGMLLLAEPPLPKQLLVFPLLYSLAFTPVAWGIGPAEDLGMATAALVAAVTLAFAGVRLPLRRPLPAPAGDRAPGGKS